MNYRFLSVVVTLACIFCGGGCHTDSKPSVKSGEIRVVSLSPNYTEIIFALGAEGALVGRTDACNYPPECKLTPVVGSYASPNWEKIYTVMPTTVLTADFSDDRAEKILLDRGIEVYRNDPRTFDDLFEAIRQTGKRVEKEAEAAQLTDALQAELNVIQAASANRADKPRVLVVVWHNPLCVVGGNTFVAQAVRIAGGVNLSDDLKQRYVNISPEKVVQYAPDVILFPQMEAGVSADALLNYPGLESVPAIKNKRIITEIPGDIILRPGPRLIQGVKALAEILSGISN